MTLQACGLILRRIVALRSAHTLLLAVSIITLCVDPVCVACPAGSLIDPRRAIGFDLGLSYGYVLSHHIKCLQWPLCLAFFALSSPLTPNRTAVANFHNYSAINLAKVEGSPRYLAFMQREMRRRASSPAYLVQLAINAPRGYCCDPNQYMGVDASEHAEILSEMLRELRAAVESTLGILLPEGSSRVLDCDSALDSQLATQFYWCQNIQ